MEAQLSVLVEAPPDVPEGNDEKLVEREKEKQTNKDNSQGSEGL